MSSFIDKATALYDEYQLDNLPINLQRNPLYYYYLSIFPSLQQMHKANTNDRIQYPKKVSTVYIHTPFCSGICDFCSYFTIKSDPHGIRISNYYRLLKKELAIHNELTNIEASYLYFGGGSPSLTPIETINGLLEYMQINDMLAAQRMGTIEIHPEFFSDEGMAHEFLSMMKNHGLNRISIGYQTSQDDILNESNRRHGSEFLCNAMKILSPHDMVINFDIMYGLPGITYEWLERTLHDVIIYQPDSISIYALFVSQGTPYYKQVLSGKIKLPSHKEIQTQHILARLILDGHGYNELPNDFFAKNGIKRNEVTQEVLPSSAATLPLGSGGYGYLNNTQFATPFSLSEYKKKIKKGVAPLWLLHNLTEAQQFHRDVMFSLKNSPNIDCSVFIEKYGKSPLDEFSKIFIFLDELNLVTINGDIIALTDKGYLCVEEISILFQPDIPECNQELTASERMSLRKHNFLPRLPFSK